MPVCSYLYYIYSPKDSLGSRVDFSRRNIISKKKKKKNAGVERIEDSRVKRQKYM